MNTHVTTQIHLPQDDDFRVTSDANCFPKRHAWSGLTFWSLHLKFGKGADVTIFMHSKDACFEVSDALQEAASKLTQATLLTSTQENPA